MMPRTRGVAALALSATLAAAGIALGGAAHADSKREVKVVLSEWVIKPTPRTVTTGQVQFVVKNAGTEIHEFVVVRGDDPDALPTDADGAVDEEQIAKRDEIGEIEDIASKKTKKVTFKLKSGKYILFCNVVDEEGTSNQVSHFAEGMVKTITVKK